MPSLRSLIVEDRHSTLTGGLFVAATLTQVGTSPRHSLTTSAAAWLCICAFVWTKGGFRKTGDPRGRTLAWIAGGLLTLSSICERAVDPGHLWWAKALLPAVVHGMLRTDMFGASSAGNPRSTSKIRNGSRQLLAVAAATGFMALKRESGLAAVVALGCCNALLIAVSLTLIQAVQREESLAEDNNSGDLSVGGLLSQSTRKQSFENETLMTVLGHISMAAALATCLAALVFESFNTQQYWFEFLVQQILIVVLGVGMVLAHAALNTGLVLAVVGRGQVSVALTLLAAALCGQLLIGFSVSRLWFATICLVSLYFHDSNSNSNPNPNQTSSSLSDRTKMRVKRLLSLLCVASLALLAVLHFRDRLTVGVASHQSPRQWTDDLRDEDNSTPLQYNNSHVHPIEQLSRDAETRFAALLQSQSRTLEEAVAEYKRRYKIPPPPNFDKWFNFAKERNVQLIDEFDTIYHSLLPFWGLKPVTIRRRVKEALGFDGNNLIALLLRDSKVSHVRSGQEWQQKATIGMMNKFIQYLPDMDLAFNIHDEPRVVVPHDELSRLVAVAKDENMAAALSSPLNRNAFSSRPKDLNDGNRVEEVKITRFNVFAHQPTWIPSRMSCSPDSPSRALEEETTSDNISAYAMSELGFIYNHTAFTDICNSPSLSVSHGFFDRPNAFNVVHDLIPIFSQSKMSSFQDIVYPSPWYWYGKVQYNSAKDLTWENKETKLWWVGSTTGGFSRDGGWRRQHRQKFVTRLNAPDQAKVMYDAHLSGATTHDDNDADWQIRSVARSDYKDLMDVHFSHIGQCDPGDCDAQRDFFGTVEPADQQDAWKYKYLLDIDGNAFSGRFYAFLQSKSLVFKMAVFREWHEEWIRPWLHYVPLSLRGEEVLEGVRYFGAEDTGKHLAIEMAERGREWSQKVLRNDDFEVWFFRLLLEYARVIDDDRENIGYAGP